MDYLSLIIFIKIVVSVYLYPTFMFYCGLLMIHGEFLVPLNHICMDLKFISMNPSASIKLLWALVDSIT